MPKMKTVRGAAKRFRSSKNKIRRGAAFRSHILTKKPTKRMRGLKESKVVDARDEKSVKLMLCKA
ncbi:MAG: 50S ribosomal protein L35 [Sulfurospirillaceae bacterium]|nr:50S ribosomal protein L35 [Sulfurospirillaceae bacterium]MDD2825386.1 50S ribosomal protein L35 [Sulfurospirillaceae bacterium]